MRMMQMTGVRDRDVPPLGVRRSGSLVAPLASVIAHEAPLAVPLRIVMGTCVLRGMATPALTLALQAMCALM